MLVLVLTRFVVGWLDFSSGHFKDDSYADVLFTVLIAIQGQEQGQISFTATDSNYQVFTFCKRNTSLHLFI